MNVDFCTLHYQNFISNNHFIIYSFRMISMNFYLSSTIFKYGRVEVLSFFKTYETFSLFYLFLSNFCLIPIIYWLMRDFSCINGCMNVLCSIGLSSSLCDWCYILISRWHLSQKNTMWASCPLIAQSSQ